MDEYIVKNKCRQYEDRIYDIMCAEHRTLHKRTSSTPVTKIRIDEDEIYLMEFSSETPVNVGAFDEILLHTSQAADFSRLSNVGSILKNHDADPAFVRPVQF